MRSVLIAVVVLAFALPALAESAEGGCPKWMTAGQCQQVSVPSDPIERALTRFAAVPLDQEPGEGCMEESNPPHSGCPHSYAIWQTFYRTCTDGTRVRCSIDYCFYDSCSMSDCAQDSYKKCCGEDVTTTSVNTCR